jgi:hypothetical protein
MARAAYRPKAFRQTVRRAAKPVTPKGDHDDSTILGGPSAFVQLRYLGAALDALFSNKPTSQ